MRKRKQVVEVEFPMPVNSTYPEGDWNILAGFWHPVALGRDVTNKPFHTTLLDVPLVVYRTKDGICAIHDRCPHRGAKFSAGGVVCDDEIVCPFHGLRFNGDGECTLVPAQGPDYKISPRMKLVTFKVEEKYGLVWVCLRNEPRQPLPVHPAFDNPPEGFTIYNMDACVWQASPLRHAENFNDIAHVHLVHAKTFGDVHIPEVPKHKVKDTETGLYRKMNILIQPRASLSEPASPGVLINTEYTFTYPFTSVLVMTNPDSKEFENIEEENFEEHLMDAVCPVSIDKIAIFMVKGRNYLPEGRYTKEIVEYQEAINEEDRAIVESQIPKLASLEPHEEIFIPADQWYAHFRRRWREMGFTNKYPS